MRCGSLLQAPPPSLAHRMNHTWTGSFMSPSPWICFCQNILSEQQEKRLGQSTATRPLHRGSHNSLPCTPPGWGLTLSKHSTTEYILAYFLTSILRQDLIKLPGLALNLLCSPSRQSSCNSLGNSYSLFLCRFLLELLPEVFALGGDHGMELVCT